jgi:hypothetical protein
MPTSSPPPVPRTDDGTAPRSSAHCLISWWSVSTRDLFDEPDLELPRDAVLLEDALRRAPRPEEALREDLLPEDLLPDDLLPDDLLPEALLLDELPRVEAVLLPRDSPVWLPCDLFRLELPEDVFLDRLLPDLLPEDEVRVLREDDFVPDDLDELLRALLLDLCAMKILPLSLCDETAQATGCQLPGTSTGLQKQAIPSALMRCGSFGRIVDRSRPRLPEQPLGTQARAPALHVYFYQYDKIQKFFCQTGNTALGASLCVPLCPLWLDRGG